MKTKLIAKSAIAACLFALPLSSWAATTMKGDLNCDNQVNSLDEGILRKYMGSRSGDKKWNPAADLNNDGVIDLKDSQLFFAEYQGRAPGDFNEDSYIDMKDFELFVSAFSSVHGDEDYHSRFDIGDKTPDGSIDFKDFLQFRKSFMKFSREGHGEENCGGHRPMRSR